MRLIFLLFLALPVFAHQYTSLDDLVVDVCAQHSFEKCSDPIIDSDGDGIPDSTDECPNDATNTCNDPIDTDGDGIPDATDECPNDPTNTCNDPVDPPVGGHLLTDVPTSEWITIPNTKIVDILPPESFVQPIHYIVGPRAIVGAWSGASWDEARQEMHIIAAGGHADYCGNEHIKLNLDDLSVSLVRGPSSLGNMTYTELGDAGATPDGNLVSRHTYGGTVYDQDRDQHYVFPGSSCDPAGDADRKVWAANGQTGETQLLMDIDLPSAGSIGWRGSRNQAIYDPITQKAWVSNMGIFYSFDPDAAVRKTFQSNQPQYPYGFKQSVAFDVDRRMMLLTGGGSFWTYNIDTNTLAKYSDKGADFKDCYSPGLAFVESQDSFVAWCGGSDLYWIDPDTLEYTASTTLGVPPTMPTYGMFGRFRWSEKYQGIVVIYHAEEDAKFLKL